MPEPSLRDRLRAEVLAVDAAALLPHHRRGALLVLAPGVDLLDVAVSIAGDDAGVIAELLAASRLARPSLAQLADWCVDADLRFQFVILQPYVLAQPLIAGPAPGTAQD